MAAERYRLETYRLPAADEELFTAELWSRGVLGVEIDSGKIDGDGIDVEEDAEQVADQVIVRAWFAEAAELGPWRCAGVERLTSEFEVARDWLAEYRQSVEPLAIGSFVIDASDEPATQTQPPRHLSIPAQTAFGTGSHESTRLVVRWLEELQPTGLRVIDVGVGSGILSFVAERLGAAWVVGFDFDTPSVCIAQQNAWHNRCAPGLLAGRLAAFRPAPVFDLALVNVLPERVLPEFPQLLRLMRPSARLISSGNLVARRQEMTDEFSRLGLVVEGEKQEGEWLSLLLRRG